MDNLASPVIQIKGLRDGLLVSLSGASWEEQRAALLAQIEEQGAFFQGARLALDVGAEVLKVNEMVELRDRLSEHNVSLWAVLSESPTTEKTAQLLGLATRISKPRPEEIHSFDAQSVGEQNALLIDKTLRSGSRVDFPGHVVILGDVNPGAEVIADGNVIVWGRLRGAVHAGAGGDEARVVCALDLLPMRLQIGEQVMKSEQKEAGKPEKAFIRDGSVIVEPWQPGNTG